MADDFAELALGDQQPRADPALDLIAVRQRFTLRQTVSTIEKADSITLVQHSVRRSWSGTRNL